MGSPGGQLGGVEPAWPVGSPDTFFIPIGPFNTDGLIVIQPLVSEARIAYINSLIAKGKHVVFVGTAIDSPAVAIDNRGGIQLAINHLIQHGHRKIAFIAGSPNDPHGDSEERLNAFHASMQEHGLDVDPKLIAYGLHIVEGGRIAMQQILEAGAHFTAVMGSSDECAIGAMDVLRKAGYRIPEDLAVIGFDDSPEAVIQDPPLTSIHSPTFERGRRVLELVLDYVTGKKYGKSVLTAPARLTIRKSCGCNSWIYAGATIIPPVGKTGLIDKLSNPDLLYKDMSEAILNRTHQMSPSKVQELCHNLLHTFRTGLHTRRSDDFLAELQNAILQTTRAGDDIHVWMAGISVLRMELPPLLTSETASLHEWAEGTLYTASQIIAEAAELQHQRFLIEQRWASDHMAALTSYLFASLNEQQILDVLSERLPEMGIPHAAIVLFEPKGTDPAASSLIRVIPGKWESAVRFATNEFPPPGVYPPSQPYNLALVPFIVRDEQLGFVAFESTRLDLFGAIVMQLGLALQDARLYREANEGRRLAEEGRLLAEAADQLKSRFLSTVSHELRTPLMVISGLSERLLEDFQTNANSSDPTKEHMERIHASAQHLDGLIRDVLDLSQNQAGQLKLACESLDPIEIITSASNVGKELAEEKGLTWRLEIPKKLPRIWGDKTRLRQVFLNLINNAVKFTENGEVRIRAQTGREKITMIVSDTGLGIPKDEQETIFDEFKQSKRTTKRGFGGLGLGLAICKQLVELHGGTIRVKSAGEEGSGSSFIVQLPILKNVRPAQHKVGHIKDTERVLVLTNQNEVGAYMRGLLLQKGFNVELGDIGREEMWQSRLMQHAFAAVVMDTEVNPERGWEILKTLKENPSTRDIPILFYSISPEDDAGSLLSLDYLTKPLVTNELDQALRYHGVTGLPSGKTVLIVDDEPTILEIHSQIVRAADPHLRVLKARDGREALVLIRDERPSLVLLDLLMPELDGFGVLEAMQNDKSLFNIPVIVLTGQTLTQEEMLRLNHGVAAVLNKGVYSIAETANFITEVLGRVPRLGSEKQHLARGAIAYIHEHYSELITRREIANHLSVSEDHLARCFHQETDLTITAYLRRFRVERAKELLAGGETNMTKIAMTLGFTDSNYFSREFRKETGISPSTYRHRL